jgi:RNA polymerase sigma factor (sigma-70 family)
VFPAVDVAIEANLAATSVDFDAFYRSTYGPVVRICVALCHDDEAAADAAQDAFIAARRRWSRVGALDRPDLWVRRVALNRAISWHRRVGAEARAVARLPLPRMEAPPDEPSEIWTLVRRLPARQAQVIALVYVDDLTVEAAASVLGISVPTAKTHLQRARRTLAAAVSEEVLYP